MSPNFPISTSFGNILISWLPSTGGTIDGYYIYFQPTILGLWSPIRTQVVGVSTSSTTLTRNSKLSYIFAIVSMNSQEATSLPLLYSYIKPIGVVDPYQNGTGLPYYANNAVGNVIDGDPVTMWQPNPLVAPNQLYYNQFTLDQSYAITGFNVTVNPNDNLHTPQSISLVSGTASYNDSSTVIQQFGVSRGTNSATLTYSLNQPLITNVVTLIYDNSQSQSQVWIYEVVFYGLPSS
jgi:hypothetical protein